MMNRILIIFILVFILFLSKLHSQIECTLKECIESYGDTIRVYENGPSLLEYILEDSQLQVGVILVNDKVVRIRYISDTIFAENKIIDFLKANNQGHKWVQINEVSTMEKTDNNMSLKFNDFKKYLRNDNNATAYYYQHSWFSDQYELLIFTDDYLEAQKNSLLLYKSKGKTQFQEESLQYAYKTNSIELLEAFFETWKDQSLTLTNDVRKKLPQFIKESYNIFEDFYNPKHIGRIANPEWSKSLYEKVSYVICQNEINIIVRESLDKFDAIDPFYENKPLYKILIEDFRPDVNDSSTKSLFFTKQYEMLLKDFLGDESLPLGYYNIMTPATEIGESEKRKDFLENRIKIFHGHWEGWHLITHPYVSSINLNQALDEAVVEFRIVYQGGRAIYKKQNEKWILIESKLTWIE